MHGMRQLLQKWQVSVCNSMLVNQQSFPKPPLCDSAKQWLRVGEFRIGTLDPGGGHQAD